MLFFSPLLSRSGHVVSSPRAWQCSARYSPALPGFTRRAEALPRGRLIRAVARVDMVVIAFLLGHREWFVAQGPRSSLFVACAVVRAPGKITGRGLTAAFGGGVAATAATRPPTPCCPSSSSSYVSTEMPSLSARSAIRSEQQTENVVWRPNKAMILGEPGTPPGLLVLLRRFFFSSSQFGRTGGQWQGPPVGVWQVVAAALACGSMFVRPGGCSLELATGTVTACFPLPGCPPASRRGALLLK